LFTGSQDGTAKMWSAETGDCLLTFEGHTAAVMSVRCAPGKSVDEAAEEAAGR